MQLMCRTFATEIELVEYAKAMILKYLGRHPRALIEELEGVVCLGNDSRPIIGLAALRLVKNNRISFFCINGAFERIPALQPQLF